MFPLLHKLKLESLEEIYLEDIFNPGNNFISTQSYLFPNFSKITFLIPFNTSDTQVFESPVSSLTVSIKYF